MAGEPQQLGRKLGCVGACESMGQTPWERGEGGEVRPGTAAGVHTLQQMY